MQISHGSNSDGVARLRYDKHAKRHDLQQVLLDSAEPTGFRRGQFPYSRARVTHCLILVPQAHGTV